MDAFRKTVTDPLAALALGADCRRGTSTLMGMLLLGYDTLGEALEVLTEYAPIIGDNARFEVDVGAESVLLRYLPTMRCAARSVEAALGCVVCLRAG